MAPVAKGKGLLNAVVFVLLEIAAILLLGSTRSLQDIWLSRATHRTLGAVWRGSENMRSYFGLRGANERLSEENTRMMEALRHYEGRIMATEGAISDTVTGSYSYVPATIVKMSRNSQHNYIILDKGRADGISPRSGIITSRGVIGVVDAVDEHFCYGLTLQNVLVSVSARLGHAGTVAPLEWSGRSSNSAILRNLPMHLEVTPGDTVWTSGFSGIFPPDIPLGITGKTRTVDGSVKECAVSLFEDFGALRYVAIVENLDRPEIERLEKEGGR